MTLLRRTVITQIVLFSVFVQLCIPNIKRANAFQQIDDSVSLTVSVMDNKGRFVSGLQQGDFSAVVNNLPQPIASFSRSVGPLSVAILFDASGSVLSSNSK